MEKIILEFREGVRRNLELGETEGFPRFRN